MTASEVVLRPTGPADEAFLRALFVDARPEFAALAMPPQEWAELIDLQLAAQRAQYLADHPAARDHVIHVGEDRVGRCWTSASEREVRLLDLAVHTAHRRTGVGRAVLDGLRGWAASAGVPLRLHVWTANEPARRLYSAAGLRVTSAPEDSNGYLAMEWPGPESATRQAS